MNQSNRQDPGTASQGCLTTGCLTIKNATGPKRWRKRVCSSRRRGYTKLSDQDCFVEMGVARFLVSLLLVRVSWFVACRKQIL